MKTSSSWLGDLSVWAIALLALNTGSACRYAHEVISWSVLLLWAHGSLQHQPDGICFLHFFVFYPCFQLMFFLSTYSWFVIFAWSLNLIQTIWIASLAFVHWWVSFIIVIKSVLEWFMGSERNNEVFFFHFVPTIICIKYYVKPPFVRNWKICFTADCSFWICCTFRPWFQYVVESKNMFFFTNIELQKLLKKMLLCEFFLFLPYSDLQNFQKSEYVGLFREQKISHRRR